MLKEVLQEVTASFDLPPYEINCGDCGHWADEVMKRLPNHQVEYWETPFGTADTEHAFLRIDGKFYDAEALEGVDDHMELPLFSKLLEKFGRQPVWCIDHNGNDLFAENKRDMTDQQVIEYREFMEIG